MLIFKGEKLLVRDGVLQFDDAPAHVARTSRDLPAVWQDLEPWCEVEPALDSGAEELGKEWGNEWVDLRVVWQRCGEEAFARAGTAYQYMNWLRHARFCSSCGAPLSPKEEDKGLACVGCGRTVYAPLHPTIIVAV